MAADIQKKKKNKDKDAIRDNKTYNQVAFMYNMDGGGGTSAAKTSPNDIGKWTLSEPRESNLSQKEQRVYLGLLDRFAGYSSGQPFKNTQGRYSVKFQKNDRLRCIVKTSFSLSY